MLPLFRIQRVEWRAPDPSGYDALLLTSANAVREAGEELAKLAALPVYAVGEATAKAVTEAKLRVKSVGKADGSALLAAAEANGDKKLFWLAGHQRSDLDWRPGVAVDMAVTYMSIALPAPADFAERVANCEAVLLHSARAAEHFGSLCAIAGIARHWVTLATLSPAIAEAAGDGWRAIAIAEEPSDASLLSALESELKQTP